MKELARLLLEQSLAVCRFDFTNSFGQSEGRAADMTISQRVRDLEMVVQYCKRRAYVNDHKVAIIGIGLGAMSAFVLESLSTNVRALVLINTPIGVDTISWTRFDEREMMRIKLKRYFHVPLTGGTALINSTFFEDGKKIDMSRCARNIKTPVLFLAGAQNAIVGKEQSEWLFEHTAARKELLIVPEFGAVEGKKGLKQIVEHTLEFLKKQGLA
jgi:pimeloyl-ACP methyl ester carboxylesterase